MVTERTEKSEQLLRVKLGLIAEVAERSRRPVSGVTALTVAIQAGTAWKRTLMAE